MVDNDAARHNLVAAFSPSLSSLSLLLSFYLCEADHPCKSWFARVPGKSNPAADPSRGEVELCCKRFDAKYGGPLFIPDWLTESLSKCSDLTSVMSNF